MVAFRDWVLALQRWRRPLLAAFCGVLAAAALPPWHLLPLLIPAFVGLVWLLDGTRTIRAALFVGWSFGAGYFLLGLNWIVEPLLVDAPRTAWLIPFAVVGLSGGMAIFTSLTCGLWAWLRHRGLIAGPGRIVALAALWTLLEWVRAWIFTGFPWNLLGYVWSLSPAMLQTASLAGVYGLSLITVLAAAMPALLGQRPGPQYRRLPIALVLVCTILLPVALFAYGSARLAAAPAPGTATVPDVRLRIVQANIPQKLKWQADQRVPNLQKHVALSRQPSADGIPPTHVIWPETAVPFFLADDTAAREFAATAIPAGGLLITGSVRSEQTADSGPRRFWNSALAIDGNAAIQATYDKSHLVPFGEYVPLRGILPIDKIVPGQGDFTPGPGRRTLRLAGLPPVGVLICYEAIFPGAAVDRADRPQWILNLTNDAWFGKRSGPAQHFAISRMRAVEEGLPLIRAANTGISGVVDPYGRILSRLPVGETGVIDTDLPVALAPTLFARLGNATIIWLLALAALFTGLLNRRVESAS